jgi:hypothetical protein
VSKKGIGAFILIIFTAILVTACGNGGGGIPKIYTIFAAEGGDQTAAWNLFSIDPATGVATVIGPIGFGVTGMDFGPDGKLYGTTSEGGGSIKTLITIDTKTGAGTLIGPTDDAGAANYPFRDITFVGAIPYGTTPCALASFDETTGLVTPNLGAVPLCQPGGGIAADKGSATVYYTVTSGEPLYTINVGTGVFTPGAIMNGGVLASQITAATFHRGTLYVVESDAGAGNRQLMTVDTTTGAMTAVGPTLAANWISAIASRDR